MSAQTFADFQVKSSPAGQVPARMSVLDVASVEMLVDVAHVEMLVDVAAVEMLVDVAHVEMLVDVAHVEMLVDVAHVETLVDVAVSLRPAKTVSSRFRWTTLPSRPASAWLRPAPARWVCVRKPV